MPLTLWRRPSPDGGLTIRAEVPGFAHKDVEVHVEPRRLIICAKRQESVEQQTERVFPMGKMSDEVFRVLDLPFEIDPHKMTAILEHAVLEVPLQKVEPRKKVRGNVRAA